MIDSRRVEAWYYWQIGNPEKFGKLEDPWKSPESSLKNVEQVRDLTYFCHGNKDFWPLWGDYASESKNIIITIYYTMEYISNEVY